MIPSKYGVNAIRGRRIAGRKGMKVSLYEVAKKSTRAILRKVGLDMARAEQMKLLNNPAGSRRAIMLRYHDIQTVIDVGANMGQYGNELREWDFKGRIISFEPTSAAFRVLSERATADAYWSVFNFAVGAENGVAEINVASNWGASSSLMPMLESHRQCDQEVQYVATEQVAIRTLDSALTGIVAPDEALLHKLDVQGFEHFVLRGATAILPQVRVIECELSFVPLYDGQLLFPQMLALLGTLGPVIKLDICSACGVS
jgi:FkbM family methyltransferase